MSDDEIVSRLLELNRDKVPNLFDNLPLRRATSVDVARRPVGLPDIETRRTAIPKATLERRLAVICTLANRLADDPHFGRTKMAKLFYLVDATQNLDLDTSYQRQAAGPLDPKALYDAETGLEALAIRYKYLGVDRSGTKIRYHRGPKVGEAMENARLVLGRNRNAINRIIDRFRKMNTDQCEIVATLYAVWNDFLIDGKQPTEEEIVASVLQWHPKKQQIAKDRWLAALPWMRQKGLIPKGIGEKTRVAQA